MWHWVVFVVLRWCHIAETRDWQPQHDTDCCRRAQLQALGKSAAPAASTAVTAGPWGVPSGLAWTQPCWIRWSVLLIVFVLPFCICVEKTCVSAGVPWMVQQSNNLTDQMKCLIESWINSMRPPWKEPPRQLRKEEAPSKQHLKCDLTNVLAN